MFKVVRSGSNRIDIDLGGKIDSEEMKVALDELFNSATDIKHGHMLFRIEHYELPTIGAIGIELARLPEAFRFIRKFDRAAVLANENWVKKTSEIEGTLIPGLEIKAFNLDEEAEAENWLAS